MNKLEEELEREAMARIREYESRDSYKKLKELTEEGREILRTHYNKYREEVQHFKKKAEENTDHEKYASMSNIPRGILCPGRMQFLVIGNAKRGRFTKKPGKSGYIYGYDKEDHLIWADRKEGSIRNREYIFWKDANVQLGLNYDSEELQLEEITEVTYDGQGRISRYLYGSFYDGNISDAVMELYSYKENKAYVTLINSYLPDDMGWFHITAGSQGAEADSDSDIFSDYINGEHIVLYLDDTGFVTKYTRYTDEYPDDIEECVPKYKLKLSGEHVPGIDKADKKAGRTQQDRLAELLKCLKTETGRKKKLEKLVDAFKNMCKISTDSEEEMLLFETGIFDFTGEGMFYFSLVRQFPNGEGEYFQLHLDAMYQPDQENSRFCESIWDEDLEENFFDFVRNSEAYQLLRDRSAKKVHVYLDET